MKIVNQTTDIAGKFRYWVELDDGDVVMFKLHVKPKTNQDVFDMADAYVANAVEELEKAPVERLKAIEKELKDLEDEKTKIEEEHPPIGEVEK